MSNIFIIAAIINPLFAILLTILFFIETKKLKRYFANIDFVINDTSRNEIRAVRDDFYKLNQNIETLSNNTNINSASISNNSELISKNSKLTKETYQNVIASIDNETKLLGIDLDGKHLEINKNHLADHFERANSLRRAGWSIQYFPYWLFLREGWIEKDIESINELKVFFIKFFNIIPKIIFDESQDKKAENYPEKDNNFISSEIKNGFKEI